ncbi:MAG TPA: hypothetical protein VJ838_15830 [Gaiellaceae bacterium]|nr:hypothetical protein [Gaiellaceae bacterium]
MSEDPLGRYGEAASGLLTVAAPQLDMNEVVVLAGDVDLVAELFVQLDAAR